MAVITGFEVIGNGEQIMVYSPKSGTWMELRYEGGIWNIECDDVKLRADSEGQVQIVDCSATFARNEEDEQ